MKARGTRGRAVRWLLLAAVAGAALYLGLFWFLRNPARSPDGPGAPQRADPGRLERDVRYLSSVVPPRNAGNVDGLERAAVHIATGFTAAGCALEVRNFEVDHTVYRNVACSFGPPAAPRLVIGAHYDVAGDANPGADDNASGVAGLLELARLIGAARPSLQHRLDLVAFALEEPPHFRSEAMGSHAYARDLRDQGVDLKLMISVEMIGYFSDESGSQHYPLGVLNWFYPGEADFIGVVGRALDRAPVARVKALMTVTPALPVYSINAPAFVTGVDFSDHWSFWQLGFPAVMVTDTAFLRNPNYHRPTDTPETLDYRRMALTVDGLYRVAVDY